MRTGLLRARRGGLDIVLVDAMFLLALFIAPLFLLVFLLTLSASLFLGRFRGVLWLSAASLA